MHRLISSSPILFKYSLCFFIILFYSLPSFTQEQIYQNFGVDDGLPSSEAYDIYQDKEGYIYFATDKGLSRYNGYEFENFNTSDGLTGNVILKFYPQKNGQIWCYSFHNQSLFYFNECFDGFKPYKYNEILKKELNKRSIVKSVYIDNEDNLHIGGAYIKGEIIIQNNGDVKTQHQYQSSPSDTLNSKVIVLNPILDSLNSESFYTTVDNIENRNQLFCNRYSSARISAKWLVENEIAVFMTHKSVDLLYRNKEKITIQTEHQVAGIKVIDQNSFFIGYEFGGGKIIDTKGIVQKEFLSDESVTSFLVDHEGGYWFTTLSSGVFYTRNPSMTIFKSKFKKSHHVNSMVKTKDNELMIGYKDGTISTITKNIELFESTTRKTTSQAFVEFDPLMNKTYLHNNHRLKDRLERKVLLTQYLLKLSEPKNKVLFAAFEGGFCKIYNDTVTQHFSPYRIHDVCVRNKDTLLATPLGIIKFQNNNYSPLSNQSTLFKFRGEDIDVDDVHNNLYIATHGAGVVIYNGNDIYNIAEKDGLNSNIVNEVHIEKDSTIWVCTNRGINRIIFDEQGISISSFSKKDGLLSNEVEDIEILNDTVWVGTKQGICNFPKSQMNSKKIDLSNLKLLNVIVNNVVQESLTKVNLPYRENKIEFVLEGISFAHKENVHYKYRLSQNSKWSTTQNRIIDFTSLNSGNYTFEAKMCIDDQNCSQKIIKYEFTIQQPFWRMWWFRILCLSIIGLLIYSFFKIRVFTYNKDVTRELIRLIIKKLKRDEMYFSFRENGKDIRVKTHEILYVKSAGNYIDVHTTNKKYTIRLNIGKFLDSVPDSLEYIRLHRSFIVRIDKITTKSKNEVQLINDIKIPVSLNHHKKLKEVLF